MANLDNPEFDIDADTIDDPSAFSMDTISGIIPAGVGTMPDVTFVANNTRINRETLADRQPFKLRVYFRPKKVGRHLCRFYFRVKGGSDQPNLVVTLRGTGSNAEIHDYYEDLG
jgi:hypothetical protein